MENKWTELGQDIKTGLKAYPIWAVFIYENYKEIWDFVYSPLNLIGRIIVLPLLFSLFFATIIAIILIGYSAITFFGSFALILLFFTTLFTKHGIR